MARRFVLILIFILALPSLLCANELWVQRTGNELLVVCVPSVCAKDVVPPVPCSSTSLKNIKIYNNLGKVVMASNTFKDQSPIQVIDHNISAVTVEQEEGFSSITPTGEKPLSKSEAKDAIETKFQINFNKTFLEWAKYLTKPLGKNLEIVPLKNPFTLKSGEKLPIIVYYDGKPRSGVWVDDRTNDGIREKTDSKGRLNITIGKPGLQVVTAYLDKPYYNLNEADKLALSSNLAYQVK